jgi:cytochrome oxidase assembly protein ShyY1
VTVAGDRTGDRQDDPDAPAPGPAPAHPGPVPWHRTARSALALFREPGWIAALIGVVLLSIAFVRLGEWQYHRHENRVVKRDRVDRNYDAAPVPLAELMPQPGRTLPRALDWRPVRVTGRYLVDETVLVRNRPVDGPGYEVLVPFALEGGHDTLVVDRGWLPTGSRAEAPDTVPAPPTGTVELVVRMRPGEPPIDRRPPPGQALRIDLQRLSADLGRPLVGGYGVLASESPAPGTAPERIPRPDPGTDINLPYAWQWWAFALAAYVLLAVGAVREVRQRRATAAGVPTSALRARPERRA